MGSCFMPWETKFVATVRMRVVAASTACVSLLLLSLCVVAIALPVSSPVSQGFGFNFFSRTNQGNTTLPTTVSEASSLGWLMAERADGHPCRQGLGIEYTEGSTTHTNARPLSLFFDAGPEGRLSAFSVRAWFDSDASYNPATWTEPSFAATTGERWVTVNTRDPSIVCSKTTTHSELLGDRLIVNALASSVFANLSIPTLVPSTPDGVFKSGACMPNMGRHWGYPLDGNTETLYGADHGVHVLPVIPMYSVPTGEGQGRVTALAFYTTEPQVTQRDGGVWDASGTPPQLCAGNFCIDSDKCEYGTSNSVFHIFFIDQYSDAAQCGSGGSPGC